MLSGFITTDSVRLSEDGAYRNWRPAARRRLSSVRSLTSWLPTRTTALPCIIKSIQPGDKLRAANETQTFTEPSTFKTVKKLCYTGLCYAKKLC